MHGKGKIKNPPKSYKLEDSISQFLNFHDKQKAKIKNVSYLLPKNWIFIGHAPELTYKSDKWDGVPRHYRHKFRKHGNVLADPKGKFILITGLNFNIKPEGITG